MLIFRPDHQHYFSHCAYSADRVDRKQYLDSSWDTKVEEHLRKPFKDSHFCRDGYMNKCWFKLIYLFESHFSVERMIKLKQFRKAFLDLILTDESIGSSKERKWILEDQKIRKKVMEETGIDIREKWSFMYPRVYNLGRKPNKINWKSERLFKKVNGTEVYDRKLNKREKVSSYFIIPKDNSSYPIGCEKCEEIVLKK